MRILVYGDFIEDVYRHVTTVRDCPERPGAPVYDVSRTERFDGCAGNVLRNVSQICQSVCPDVTIDIGGGMGFEAYDAFVPRLASITGDSELLALSVVDIVKERIICDGRIVCRVDSARMFHFLHDHPPVPADRHYDLLIVSDYCFGGVQPDVCRELIGRSAVSVVDTKRGDLSMFAGATAFKFNRHEYAKHVQEGSTIPADWIVVSHGDRGAAVIRGQAGSLRKGHADTVRFPAWTDVSEVDVTGCGDTFTATLGLYLAMGSIIDGAAYRANYLASRVVTRMGPGSPTAEEIAEGIRRGIL